MSARLYCHAINVSNRLYSQGEWRADGELKQDLSRLMELDRQVSERLRQVFVRHTFADLGPANAPAITAGVVAYPHSEVLRPEDLFTLAENALQQAKSGSPDRIAVIGEN